MKSSQKVLLDAEYRRGFENGFDTGRPPMIGLVLWSCICAVAGALSMWAVLL